MLLSLLLSLLVPLCGGLLAAVAGMVLADTHEPNAPWKNLSGSHSFVDFLKPFLRTMAAEWIVFLCCSAAVELFMFTDVRRIPVVVLVTAAILPFAERLTVLFGKREYIRKFLRVVAVSSLVLMLTETFICNFKSASMGKTDVTVPASAVTLDNQVTLVENEFMITGLSALEVYDMPRDAKAIILSMSTSNRENAKRFTMSVLMKDNNISQAFTTVRTSEYAGFDKDYVVTLNPHESLNAVRILFDHVTEPITVHSIRFVSAAPFDFSCLRYFLLLALIALISWARYFGVADMKISGNTKAHQFLFYLVAAACTLSVFLVIPPGKAEITEYDPNFNYIGGPQYMRVFDAWQHGHVWVADADPALVAMENPYDRSKRDADGVPYYWDMAYKDGKYYVYFGAAPVVAFFYPFYALSNGSIPFLNTVNMCMGLMAVFFLCMMLRALARMFAPDGNFLLFLLMLPVSVAAVGIYYLLNFSNDYSVPVMAGFCYLFLCLWLGISACDRELSMTKRLVSLFFSGLALALCAGSRPTLAVSAAPLIPLFLGILLRKEEKLSDRLKSAGVFVAPLFVGVGLILFYNKLRFGSLFDFGTSYQLTVSNVAANKLDIKSFPDAFYAYFLQAPKGRGTFPFFEHEVLALMDAGKYIYASEGNIGVLCYPFILLGLLYLPFGLKKRSASDDGSMKISVLQNNAFLLTCVGTALLLAWMDFCMAGVTRRYTLDGLPLLLLVSVITLLRVTRQPKSDKFRYFLAVGALAATWCFCLLLELPLRDGGLSTTLPSLYENVVDLFQFWK